MTFISEYSSSSQYQSWVVLLPRWASQPQPDTHDTNSPLSPLLHDLLRVLHRPGLVLDRTGAAVQSQHVPEVADLSPRAPRVQQPSTVSERNGLLPLLVTRLDKWMLDLSSSYLGQETGSMNSSCSWSLWLRPPSPVGPSWCGSGEPGCPAEVTPPPLWPPLRPDRDVSW